MAELVVELNDYEVIGIGSLFRQKILALQKNAKIVLHNHDIEFLPGQREETELWLQPQEICRGTQLDMAKVQKNHLSKYFPVSKQILQLERSKIIENYCNEFTWQSGLLMDSYRYLSPFVSKASKSSDLQELVSWEWNLLSLGYMDMGGVRAQSGTAQLANNFKTMQLAVDNHYLNRMRGHYLFCFVADGSEILVEAIDSVFLQMITMMQEGLVLSEQEWFELFVQEKLASAEYLQSLFKKMHHYQMLV